MKLISKMFFILKIGFVGFLPFIGSGKLSSTEKIHECSITQNLWEEGLPVCLPVCYWQGYSFTNFGDYLSLKIVERIVGERVQPYQKLQHKGQKKLLAVGSIMALAEDGDVVWGSGVSGKSLNLNRYQFTVLDVRAVRGPMSREFLIKNFNIPCPEIYGDPALLLPMLFPEFKRSKNPSREYIIIPHYKELHLFPREHYPNVVSPLEPWDQVVQAILDSKFVISSSLHGLIVAEAFGIPARLLKVTFIEPLFKYKDYYLGTQRPHFQYATSIEEALSMGGEKPFTCDLQKLYNAFPFEFWPSSQQTYQK